MKIRKIITGTAAIFMSVTLAFQSFASLLGDVDKDGKITAADARNVLRVSTGLDDFPQDTEAYDYDKDGKITSADARLILRYSAGLENSYGEYYKAKLSIVDLEKNPFRQTRLYYNADRSIKKTEIFDTGDIIFSNTYCYGENGIISCITEENGNKITFTPEKTLDGTVYRGKNADGKEYSFYYDNSGRLYKAENPAGMYKTDTMGRITENTDNETGSRIKYTYFHDTDLVLTAVMKDGKTVKNEYNSDGKLIRSTFFGADGEYEGKKEIIRATHNINVFAFYGKDGKADGDTIETLTYDENNNLLADVMSRRVKDIEEEEYDKYLISEYTWKEISAKGETT